MRWFHRHERRVDALAVDTADASTLDDDTAALRELEEHGARLDLPRSVRHYLITPSRTAANTACLQLREADYNSAISENPTAPGWIIVAERVETLDADSLRLGRSLMELIASRLPDGEYDGWQAELLDAEEALLPPELMPQ